MVHVAEKLTEVNIGISTEQREKVVHILNTLLADEYVLYAKTKNYHWNVRGKNFYELHGFFGTQYETLDEIVDEVAERTGTLGGKALGTLTEMLQNSRIKEYPNKYPEAKEMIKNLLSDHEAIVRSLHNDIENIQDKYHDIGTLEILTNLISKHEKMAWMLRSFIEED